VYVKDSEGRKLLANASDLLQMGIKSEEEVIGKTDLELYGADRGPASYAEDLHVLKTGEALINHEIVYLDKSGNKVWKLISKIPLFNENKDIIGLVGIGENITERKLEEEHLKNSELRLRELNATKDKFFSIIAHDLKNPFSAIIGFSELLLRDFENFDTEKRGQYLKIIADSSKQALGLLENLLIWSRSQTGRIEFKPVETDLKYSVLNCVSMTEGLANQKNIQVSTVFPPQTLAICDKDMFETVVRNLLTNAIKFTPKNGKISLEIVKDAGGFEIIVKDSGVGIAKEDLSKLFQIDGKYKRSGTEDEKGTGLGLILCKEFVEKHGGKIRAESKEGEGSSFIFTIPG